MGSMHVCFEAQGLNRWKRSGVTCGSLLPQKLQICKIPRSDLVAILHYLAVLNCLGSCAAAGPHQAQQLSHQARGHQAQRHQTRDQCLLYNGLHLTCSVDMHVCCSSAGCGWICKAARERYWEAHKKLFGEVRGLIWKADAVQSTSTHI